MLVQPESFAVAAPIGHASSPKSFSRPFGPPVPVGSPLKTTVHSDGMATDSSQRCCSTVVRVTIMSWLGAVVIAEASDYFTRAV